MVKVGVGNLKVCVLTVQKTSNDIKNWPEKALCAVASLQDFLTICGFFPF